MKSDFYKLNIQKSPFGFAYHRIILDSDNNPVDYEFIDVNEKFEEITGLKKYDVLLRKVTEVLPDIKKGEFDWIKVYGDVAINQKNKEFEQYSEPLKKWYKVQVYSPEKYYFITNFVDITTEKKYIEQLEDLSIFTSNHIDINKVKQLDCDDYLQRICQLTGARYGVFNIYSNDQKTFQNVSIYGITDNIIKVSKILGYNLKDKKWSATQKRVNEISNGKFVEFSDLHKLNHDTISKSVINTVIKTFHLGKIYVREIRSAEKLIGDFILFFRDSEQLNNMKIADIYVNQIALLLERKKSDELLNLNQQRFDLALEGADVGLWDWDIKSNFVFYNHKWKSMLGYDEDDIENSFDGWKKLWHPDDVAKIDKAVNDYLEGKTEKYEIIHRLRNKDGFYQWILTRGDVIKNQKGETTRWVGTNIDITNQKSIEEQLSCFFDINLDLLCIADIEGNFIKINKAWETTFGYTEEEFFKSKFFDFIHEYDIESTMEQVDKLKNQQSVVSYINRIKCKSGEYKYIEWRSRSVKNIIYAAARDITDHVLKEKKLQDKDDFYNKLLSSVPGAVYQYRMYPDGSSCFPFSTKGIYDVYNVMPEEVVSDAGVVFDKIHKDDLEKVSRSIKDSFENCSVWDFEYRVNLEEGERWLHGTANPEKLEDGSVVWNGYIRDITDRKSINLKLIDNEANFRSFFESISDMIFIAKENGDVIYINDCVRNKLGYELDEVKNIGILGVHPENVREEAQQIFQDMFAGKRQYCPLPLQAKDTKLIPVETRIWFGKWNGETALFGISKDLSKEQEALQKFNKLFDNNPALMAVTSYPDRVFTEVNNSFLEKLGYDLGEVIGKTSKDLDLFVEDEKQKQMVQELDENNRVNNIELQIRTKKGEILTGLFSGEIIQSQGEKYFLTVMADITEQKKAELDALNASKVKSEFLANMSHEIRTPLNGVVGFTELLGNTKLSASQKVYIDNAKNSALALLDIINDILDFSKIEAGKLELEVIRTDIISLVEQAIDIIKFNAAQKGLELLLNIDPVIPRFCYVDPVRLKQIIVNLIGNSIKFTDEGEIELSLSFEHLTNDKSDDLYKLNFTVKDSGIGIKEDDQKKLFKAFSQADTSTTRKFGGTGLGLVISNALLKKMDSTLELKSEYGVGSTFSFSIVSKGEYGNKKEFKAPQNFKKILIVDDNDNNRLILEKMLESWEIESDSAESGLKALEYLEKSNYDVIIMDYLMPYMNGIETIKLIRKNFSANKDPIILLHSSADDYEIFGECKKLFVDYKIVKPVKFSDLYRILCEIHSNELDREISETKNNGILSEEDKDIKILVVEDNPINMLLTESFLQQIFKTFTMTKAIDGKNAITEYKENEFDIILMDVQMPVMDGYKATQKIRDFEKEKNKHTPIIALTAGVVKGEKERCIEAGMDDYLSKPLEQLKLKNMIEKYVGTYDNIDKKLISIQQSDEDSTHFDKKTVIREIGSNTEIYIKLLKEIPQIIEGNIEILNEAIDKKNIEDINYAGKKIKNGALNLSLDKLVQLASQLEIAKTFNERVEMLHKEIINEFIIIKDILKKEEVNY